MRNYRYAEEYKRKLVKDIESGKYRSADEAKKLLQIGGSMTIYNWMAKYGKNVKLADTKRVSIILDNKKIKKFGSCLTEKLFLIYTLRAIYNNVIHN